MTETKEAVVTDRGRLCLLSDDFLPANTGVGIYLQRVAPELVKQGYEVTVITSKRSGEQAFEVWKGVKVYRTFSVKMFGFYQALPSKKTIRSIFQKEKIEIVHHHYVGLLLKRAYDAAKGLGLIHLYTYHFSIDLLTKPLPMRPMKPLIKSLYYRYCNLFDGILTPSKALQEQIRELAPNPPITVMSNPVAFDVENDKAPERQYDGRPKILFVGRLGHEKNLSYLFEAVAMLVAEGIIVDVEVIGDGPEKNTLLTVVERLDLGARVEFKGLIPHPELPKHYATADIFVLPSVSEVQPMVVIEAMCFGLPAIVTNKIAAGPELVDHGTTGFIVNAEEPQDLATRLKELVTQPELRNKMGEAAVGKSKEYALPTIVKRLDDYYQSIARSS